MKKNSKNDTDYTNNDLKENEIKSITQLYHLLRNEKKYSNDGFNLKVDIIINDIEFNDEQLINILKKVDPYQIVYFSKVIVEEVESKRKKSEFIINESSIARALWGIQTLDIKRI